MRDKQRWQNDKDSVALKDAMAKHGKEHFIREIVEDNVSTELLNEREIYWIAYFGDFIEGYNLTEGGDGVGSGEKHPMFGRTGEKHPMFGRTGEKHPMFGRTGEKHPMFGRTGEKNPNFGNRGEKNPNTRPEYIQARMFFFVEIAPMKASLTEKRQHFYKAFEQIRRDTLWRWFRKWNAELES